MSQYAFLWYCGSLNKFKKKKKNMHGYNGCVVISFSYFPNLGEITMILKTVNS